jgi:hypothetical protein
MYYKYLKVRMDDRRCFCVQQSALTLAWVLFCKRNPVKPVVRSFSGSLSGRLKSIRQAWRLLRKKVRVNVEILFVFMREKYYFKSSGAGIELPVYGQVCIAVHKGYKIFDMRRGVVIKLFDNDVRSSEVAREVETLRKVSKLGSAPSLKRWNINEKWYEEVYVHGSLDSSYKPMETNDLLKKFRGIIMPCLEEVMTYQEPRVTTLQQYLAGISRNFEETALLGKGLDAESCWRIAQFYRSLHAGLHSEKDRNLFLVFSHGDFCPANMLNIDHAVKVIDWEEACYRSALFDFFSYFFYRSISRRVDTRQVKKEIGEAWILLQGRLAVPAPTIYQSVSTSVNVYRRVYYIERLDMLIERLGSDKYSAIIKDIHESIKAFEGFEEHVLEEESLKESEGHG